APTDAQLQQIVAFESGIFTAQSFDNNVHALGKDGASGGPIALSQLVTSFFVGINDPFGLNPNNTPFTSIIFTLYEAWANASPPDAAAEARAAVARGEEIFNTFPINISGVAGINDVLQQANVAGNCGTCHDTPNVGDHSVK